MRWTKLLLLAPMVIACASTSRDRLIRRYDALYAKNLFVAAAEPAGRLLVIAEASRDAGERAEALNRLGDVALKLDHATDAEAYYQRALLAAQSNLPAMALVSGLAWSGIGKSLNRLGQYPDAESALQTSIQMLTALARSSLADRGLAENLDELASVYSRLGRQSEAVDTNHRAIRLATVAAGPDSPEVASYSANLAGIYGRQGDYETARKLVASALDSLARTSGRDSLEFNRVLLRRASLAHAEGAYSDAARDFETGISALERLLPPGHGDLARALSNFCLTEIALAEYTSAEKRCQRALQIFESGSESGHVERFAAVLINLGNVYHELGDYAQAEKYYRRSQDALVESLGARHESVGSVLYDLGALYLDQGFTAKAVPLLKQALSIKREHLGLSHPDVAQCLNTLGNAAITEGRTDAALALYEEALSIWQKAYGTSHPDVAMVLGRIADTCKDPCKIDDRLKLATRAVEISKEVFGGQHPRVGSALSALAQVHADRGQYLKAASFFGDAEAIYEATRGSLSPFTTTALRQMGWSYLRGGDLKRGLQAFARMEKSEEQQLRVFLGTVTEDRQRAFLEDARASLDYIVSAQQRLFPASTSFSKLALVAAIGRKARALDATTAQLETVRGESSSPEAAHMGELRRVRAELSSLILRGPAESSGGQYIENLQELERREATLEEGVASLGEREARPIPTLEEVADRLPRRSALVEIVRYSSPNDGETDRYAIYALKSRDSRVLSVDVGPARQIDNLIRKFRSALGTPNGESRKYGRLLDAKVMEPLGAFLKGIDRLFIAPDSAFHLVPFAAFVDPHGHFRLDTWELSYIGSGRDLLRNPTTFSLPSPPLVVGNPEFSSVAKNETRPIVQGARPAILASNRRSVDYVARSFAPLPGSDREARLVATALGVSAALGAEASEEKIKSTRSPVVLHVATHAFFLKDLPHSIPDQSGAFGEAGASLSRLESPMLRSGLALAGANVQTMSGEDGVLTALEAATLDLSATELVVLSACDTGLGEVDRGEGVLGLRRAFSLAGARSVVMSLWSVNDVATSRLMEEYYRRLMRGEGRSAALRAIQHEFSIDPVVSDPYYWAPFILAGESGAIETFTGTQ